MLNNCQMHDVIFEFPGDPGRSIRLAVDFPHDVTVGMLKDQIEREYGLLAAEQRLLTLGGLYIADSDKVTSLPQPCPHTSMLRLSVRGRGGKGGFGSMLRAQGGRMASKKTSNYESCRDLSGRRLKTINTAKQMAEYMAREPERQRVKRETLRQKLVKASQEPPAKKIRFDDPEFLRESEELVDNVRAAVGNANQVAKDKQKAKANSLKLWDGDFEESEDEPESEGKSGDESSGVEGVVVEPEAAGESSGKSLPQRTESIGA